MAKQNRKEKRSQAPVISEKEKTTYTPNNKYTTIILGLFIALIGCLFYVNTFKHGYVLDDISLITANTVVKKGFAGIGEIFHTTYRYGFWHKADGLYRPLSLTIFAIEWQLSPNHPMLGHIVNVLCYALLGFLIFKVLRNLFSEYNLIIPFVASLLFIAHPVHTEVVANIKSLDEMVTLIFCLLTLIFFRKYLAQSKSILNLIIAMICYFLAFLTKEGAVTFIAVIALVVVLFEKENKLKSLAKTGLLIIPFALFMFIRMQVFKAGGFTGEATSILDNFLIGANSLSIRLASAIQVLGIYAKLLFFPKTLVCYSNYNQFPLVTWGNIRVLVSLLFYFGIFFLAILNFKKNKLLTFGIGFFLITISLYANIIILIGTDYAERLLFTPSLGFSIAIASILAFFIKKTDNTIPSIKQFIVQNNKVLALLMLIVIIFGFKTIDRNKAWNNHYSLFHTDVVNSPKSAHLRYEYGLEFMKTKSQKATNDIDKMRYLDSAIVQFETALEIYPNYYQVFESLGLAYYRKKEYDKALPFYQKAILYTPTVSSLYTNMGAIYFDRQDYKKAVEIFLLAVKYNPNDADALQNLGSSYGVLNKLDLAIDCFKKSIAIEPNKAQVYYLLAITYKNKGDNINAEKNMKLFEEIKKAAY